MQDPALQAAGLPPVRLCLHIPADIPQHIQLMLRGTSFAWMETVTLLLATPGALQGAAGQPWGRMGQEQGQWWPRDLPSFVLPLL